MEVKSIPYGLGTLLVGGWQLVQNQRAEELAATREYELAQKRLDVQSAEAKRDTEVAAMIAAQEQANNANLWKIVSYAVGALGVAMIAVGVGRIFGKKG